MLEDPDSMQEGLFFCSWAGCSRRAPRWTRTYTWPGTLPPMCKMATTTYRGPNLSSAGITNYDNSGQEYSRTPWDMQQYQYQWMQLPHLGRTTYVDLYRSPNSKHVQSASIVQYTYNSLRMFCVASYTSHALYLVAIQIIQTSMRYLHRHIYQLACVHRL